MKVEAIVLDKEDDMKQKDAIVTVGEEMDFLSPLYLIPSDYTQREYEHHIKAKDRKHVQELMDPDKDLGRYVIHRLGTSVYASDVGIFGSGRVMPETVEEYEGIKFKADVAGHKRAQVTVLRGEDALNLNINLGPADITEFTCNAPLYTDGSSVNLYILPFGLYIGRHTHGRITCKPTRWSATEWSVPISPNIRLQSLIKFIKDNHEWFEYLMGCVAGVSDLTSVTDRKAAKYLKALSVWAMDEEELPTLEVVSAASYFDCYLSDLLPDSCFDSCMDKVTDNMVPIPEDRIIYGVPEFLDKCLSEVKEILDR